MNYGTTLYKLRKQKSLSQEEVANELGVSRQSISLWETNQASPSMDNLIAFARLFKVSLDEIVGLRDNQTIINNKDTAAFKFTYHEDKHIIYRRDYQYIHTGKELFLFFLSMFFYSLALGMMLRASNLVIDVARIVLAISLVLVIIGLLIYPLYIIKNIQIKLKRNNQYIIELYKDHIQFSNSNLKGEMVDYKMIDYYIEKKDYYLLYIIKGNRLYLPKNGMEGLNGYLLDRVTKRKRVKPIWNKN